MWKAVAPPRFREDDVADFTARLDHQIAALDGVFPHFLRGERPVFLARAPGRLDVMGGIADYSGARVLQAPLADATIAVAEGRNDTLVRVASVDPEGKAPPRTVTLDLARAGRAVLGEYAAARAYFGETLGAQWAGYVLGILTVWRAERGFVPAHGVDLLVASHVPEGKGVSSSAALEVASSVALGAVYGITEDARTAALHAQKVENLVVGAPCGVMDQMTSMCGSKGKLLKLLCRPAEIEGHLPIDERLGIWGIDSGVRHCVGGGDYGQVRTAAFMGHRIITSLLGCPAYETENGWAIDDDPFHGHLTEIPVDRFTHDFEPHLPETLRGEKFLALYGGTIDRITRVDPDRDYPVRAATAHPVHEADRIARFEGGISGRNHRIDADALGAMMYASHASYSACGLGSDGTDFIVNLVRASRSVPRLFGAKITGGGSGGTVAVLGERSAFAVVQDIARIYTHETGRPARVFSGSSPGAREFGVLEIRRIKDA